MGLMGFPITVIYPLLSIKSIRISQIINLREFGFHSYCLKAMIIIDKKSVSDGISCLECLGRKKSFRQIPDFPKNQTISRTYGVWMKLYFYRKKPSKECLYRKQTGSTFLIFLGSKSWYSRQREVNYSLQISGHSFEKSKISYTLARSIFEK